MQATEEQAAKTWDVLGIGSVAVDDLVYVDHYPPPDCKMEARSMRRQGGGLTATALVAAARLGARAAYMTVLGYDELSRYSLQELEREGVDCTPVVRREGARPYYAIVIVDQSTGGRNIFYTGEGVTEPGVGDLDEALIGRCRVLFLDSYSSEAGLRAVAMAKAQYIPVVADIEISSHPLALALAQRVDHLIVNREFAGQVTDESDPERMVRALSGPERACCVVTGGDQGCWYAERGGAVHYFPAFRVPVVDTTGCGDVFHGAYAACIAAGKSVPEAIRVAAATAALKATQPGGRSGIPNLARVQEFLATGR